jgi:hypothetical protein
MQVVFGIVCGMWAYAQIEPRPAQCDTHGVTSWNAVGLGAVDLRGFNVGESDAETAIIPVKPAQPAVIKGPVAELWRRLVEGTVDDEELTDDEQTLLWTFADYGIASENRDHPNRLMTVPTPWLMSFSHELVYALVAQIASQEGLRAIFIKGPVEYRQGLRTRQHSGDVDVWIEPGGIPALARAMAPWGWRIAPDPWEGTAVNHTTTLRPPRTWGCEIDVHRYFPGCALTAARAFESLSRRTEPTSFGGVQVRVPSVAAQAVILALHLTRPEVGFVTSTARIAEAADVLRKGGYDAAAFAREFGADAALLQPLRLAFPEREFAPSCELPENWLWRAQPTRLRAYLQE